MGYNGHAYVKSSLLVTYTDECGIYNRMSFPVAEAECHGQTCIVHFNDSKVKVNLMMVLNLLEGKNIDHSLYLLCTDFDGGLTYTPVSIIGNQANYIILRMTDELFADAYLVMEDSPQHCDKSHDMPIIYQLWYNEPYTTIKWSDGSITTSKCSKNETFSKEVGLAMCISKKYLEYRGFEYPRQGFKYIANLGVDLKAIHDKRNEKKMAKKRAEDSSTKE